MDFDQIQSEALTRNMDLTNIKVEIPVSFGVLVEAVKGYAGKEKQARELLLEYHHKYRNWFFVVQETQRYAVTNLRVYRNTPLAGNVIFLLSRILLHALQESERFEIRSLAADHLLSYWMKLTEEMPEELGKPLPEGVTPGNLDTCFDRDGSCHQGILRAFFLELGGLPDAPFEFLLRSFYPPKRLAARLLNIWRDNESFAELRAFLQRFFRATYTFWLKREDPCSWLMQQEGGAEFCSGAAWFQECVPSTTSISATA